MHVVNGFKEIVEWKTTDDQLGQKYIENPSQMTTALSIILVLDSGCGHLILNAGIVFAPATSMLQSLTYWSTNNLKRI